MSSKNKKNKAKNKNQSNKSKKPTVYQRTSSTEAVISQPQIEPSTSDLVDDLSTEEVDDLLDESLSEIDETTSSAKEEDIDLDGENEEEDQYYSHKREEADQYYTLKKEEADQYYSSQKKEADQYYTLKIEKADNYYSHKREEADSLESKKEERIKKEVENAIKEKEKEIKSQKDDALKKADEIVKKAKKEANEELARSTERAKQLDERGRELIQMKAELESSKISYKKEVLDDIQEELNSISSDKEELEKEIESYKEKIKKIESNVASLKEDKQFYEDELSKNYVKKSEILEYKTKVDGLKSDYETINKLYKQIQDENSKLKSQILLYGDDPSKAIQRNVQLEKRVNELETLLKSCPSQEELDILRKNTSKFEQISNKLEILEHEKLRLEVENNELKVNKDEIESYRKFIKILELQKGELQRELDRNIQLYNNSNEKVFASLSLIDEAVCVNHPNIVKAKSITLKKLCEDFRGFLANRENNPLFYDEKTIRTFIAGFASSRLMILEGLSGTGKSSLPRAFQDFMGSRTIEVPIQSSWKDRNDLLGFYNDFKKQYKETEFLKALYTATHDKNNIYIIVLDEMNLSRIEYYFADLLSVLEKPNVEEWQVELISDYASITQDSKAWPKLIHEGKLQISDNTWFVGTANKDDSTFIITDKVYDRSVVLYFDKKGENEKIKNASPIKMNNEEFLSLLRKESNFSAKEKENRFKEMLKCLDDFVREQFQITFGNRIANQLEKFVPVYVACGGTVDEAIDIMFSRKVLRKLEGLYDENTKTNLEIFKDEIKSKKFDMQITIKAIEQMIEKI